MIEYEVEIGARPLGVRFAHADHGGTVVVHLVLENKVGHSLGLLPGDILIAIDGNSVLDSSSSEALEFFRSQKLPFKASFRRFEDDDDFDSDEDNSDTDLQSHFQQEDVSSIMHALSSHTGATNQKHRKANQSMSMSVQEWNNKDILEWLLNFGASLNDKSRFIKYQKIFSENNIDGKSLRNLDKVDLKKMGVDAKDVIDLYMGIQQLNHIVFSQQPAPMSALGQKLNKNDDEDDDLEDNDDTMDGDDDIKAKDDDDDEEDNWEAPFLPYMYDAPQVTLSEKTSVKVYSARVVSPYKKKAFALYEIEVMEGKDEWLLSKRYTEFYRLFEAMKKLKCKTKMSFPKKGLFYKSTDKQVMEDRKKKLTAYLNELLKQHPAARDSKQLSDFLSPSRTFVVDE